jgi:D-alanine-D-alanine ligase
VPDYEQVCAKLGSPFFVKPASQGSSVGVAKVSSAEQYGQAVESAFNFDNTILLEHYVEGREIECAVLGNRHPMASVVGEILCEHEFYSYQAKYVDEHGTSLQIPAKMTMKLAAKVQALALETFRVLCCKGLARIDFFVTKDERIVVNEVNTMPGFTSISMFPRLWQASGICYSALINRLLLLALEQFDYDNRAKTGLAAA